ncbi:hypothetical protein [Brevundimonas sp. PAMC22021]|uniref:hypothetical protein n=1 Tax=Brevundimonas sp. PAMC22021 TaxID=2861285 RepID=UPI001C62498E|nr:hypothetical protein [Brevundimonas sp. PAMC22021]QYF85961.1 hypothetical protein KY493_08775 [Brevundimonas sp. PAMC22021]
MLTPLSVPLTLNGRFLGTINIEVNLAGQGQIDTIRLRELLEARVAPSVLQAIDTAAQGRRRAPFDELGVAGFALAFDSASLEMRATVGGAGLNATSLALSGEQVAPDPTAYIQPARFSAGLGVNLLASYDHDEDQASPPWAAFDGIVNFGGFRGVTAVGGWDFDGGQDDGRWRRREFRLIKDFYDSAVRATAGEFTPGASSFQGSGRMLGIGVERAYATVRPFQNVRPAGREEFTLDREATVDVIVNGIRVDTLQLEAGRYSLSDFPFTTGSNEVRLVLDDIAGRREVAVFDAFSGGDLLGRDITEFGFGAGRREGEDNLKFDGDWTLTGYYRRGLTDALTVGGDMQSSASRLMGGANSTWGSPYGLLLVEAAASRDDGGRFGSAFSANHRQTFSVRQRDDVRITSALQYLSTWFNDVFSPAQKNPQAWRASVLGQWTLPREIGAGLGLAFIKGRDAPDEHSIDLGLSRAFGRVSVVANLAWTKVEGFRDEARFLIGLRMPLGERWSGAVRYDSEDRRSEAVIERYSRGTLGDISGEVRLLNDRRDRNVSGRALYINNRFEAQANHNQRFDALDGRRSLARSDVRIGSFLGYADGAFALGRPTNDAFIISPVHSSLRQSRVDIVSGDNVVARAGALGPALVPLQRAYGVNRFGIVVNPLPRGYDLGSGVLETFPGFGSGYRMMIGSDASRIALGVLMGPSGPLVLGAGRIRPTGAGASAERPFFTNRGGRFVADGLAPDRYEILIGDEVAAEFVIPRESQGVVNVGTIQLR